MAAKQKWKKTGKAVGKAFSNFGRAFAKTMKVTFTDDINYIEANGHTETANRWKETGKAFGEAGKDLGDALEETFTNKEKDD